MIRLLVGLPHLSQGQLFHKAAEMNAPVMVSAGCLGKWQTQEHRGRRFRDWTGWNTRPLDRALDSGLEIHLDSAGFVAMALRGGYDWSPESYVEDLVAHPAVTRASSMDLCVEREVAHNRAEVEERIAKTINLNHRCYHAAKSIGAAHKLMPVIQGDCVEDYLRCFEGIQSIVPEHAVIGVGSMCRRPTGGATGAVAIVAGLDAQLPANVRLHLFGVKSDAAEAVTMFGDRVASVDSQSYGTRARMLAGEKRKDDPDFSKTDAFVSEVMQEWYEKQSMRLAMPRSFPVQKSLELQAGEQPRTVIDAIEADVRREFNELIAQGALDHDQIVGGRMLEEDVMERLSMLPHGVRPSDAYQGTWQLPEIDTVH